MAVNDVVLDKIVQDVWKLNGFDLFQDLYEKKLIGEGTIKATDLVDEDYLFNFRAALVAHNYEAETGNTLEEDK